MSNGEMVVAARIGCDRRRQQHVWRLALAGLVAALTLLGVAMPAQAQVTCFGLPITMQGSGPIAGTPGADVILGSSRNGQIIGGGGNDSICGGDGDDVILALPVGASYVSVQIDGGRGNDTVNLGFTYIPVASANLILGGPGDDAIGGLGFADNTLLGGDGNDRIWGADEASNHIEGGNGNYEIEGGATAWNLMDGAGDDIVTGGPGMLGARTENDLLGGVGADRLVGRDDAANRFDGGRDDDFDTCVRSQTGVDTLTRCDGER